MYNLKINLGAFLQRQFELKFCSIFVLRKPAIWYISHTHILAPVQENPPTYSTNFITKVLHTFGEFLPGKVTISFFKLS